MIETLTDDNRKRIRDVCGTDTLRLIEAQAAVIERVRTATRDYSLSNLEARTAIADALAAAPEHTGPDADTNAMLHGQLQQSRASLATATAKVAELEAQVSALQGATEVLSGAEARADAAERRRADVLETQTDKHLRLLERAESEAEAMRAENSDLHSRVAELEAVLDQESRAKLEAMAAVERLSSAPSQPHVTQLRLRQQLDADQS